jgi:tetratricopeptide (TPR) repeat protein
MTPGAKRRWAVFRGVALAGSCALASTASAGCGGAVSSTRTTARAASMPVPTVVTPESYAAVRRAWETLDASDPARAAVRERLVAALARETEPAMEAGDYDAVVARFREFTALYTDRELEAGPLPRALVPLATWLVDAGSPRGDEARVLAAYFVLARADASDTTHAQKYDALLAWGREARSRLPDPLERFLGLGEVLREHARLVPARTVLDGLANFYVERALFCERVLRRVLHALERPAFRGMASNAAIAMVMSAATDTAGVHVRIGDLSTALANVERLRDAPDFQAEPVFQALAAARQNTPEGNDALLALARRFMQPGTAEPEAARALCRLGQRRAADDPRFELCLARASMREDRYDDVAAHYDAAIRLAPGERAVYDEALLTLYEILGGTSQGVSVEPNAPYIRIGTEGLRARVAAGEGHGDPRALAALARRTTAILTARDARFPTARATVPPHAVFGVVAAALLGVADLDAARDSLERSMAATPTSDMAFALAVIDERRGEPARAAVAYRRALDLARGSGPDNHARRTHILLALGDAFQRAGDAAQAERMYREALVARSRIVQTSLHAVRFAVTAAHAAALHDRLGQRAEATAAARDALARAGHELEPYAALLTHLLTRPQVDAALADEALRATRARADRTTAIEVRVALWSQLLAARAGTPADAARTAALTSLARRSGWHGSLARFATGQLTLDALLADAPGPVEQTRAHFADGVLRLAAGDERAARAAFARAVAIGMVFAEEHEIAWRLLALPEGSLVAPAPTAPASSPAPTAAPAAAPAAAPPQRARRNR